MSEKVTSHQILSVEFAIKGEILTKLRPRAAVIGGHARIYTPKDTVNYETHIKQSYLAATKEKHEYFKDWPIRVEVIAYFKAPKNLDFYTDEEIKSLRCVKHKDLDNIAKTVCDALNKVAYDDDKNITTLIVQKEWTREEEQIVVCIFTDGETEEEHRNLCKVNRLMKEYAEEKKKPNPDQKKLDKIWAKIVPYIPEKEAKGKQEESPTKPN